MHNIIDIQYNTKMSAAQRSEILGKLGNYKTPPSNAASQLKAPPASSFGKEGEKTNIQILFTRLYRAFSNLLERIAKSDLNGMANEYVRMYTASQTPHPEYSDIVSKMSNLSNTIEQKLLSPSK